MNVEQTLTDELGVVAQTVTAPPPPAVTALVQQAASARTRSRVRWAATTLLAAAAVVAAVVLGSQVGRPNAAPQPATPSPSYYASGVPYVHKGVLYVDHKERPGEWVRSQSAGDYTVATRADDAMVIFRDGAEVDSVSGDGVLWSALSGDGTKMAWISRQDGRTGALIVRDLAASHDLGRLSVRLREQGDHGVGLSMAVDDDGTVRYQIGDGSWRSWKPGAGAPIKARQPADEVTTPPGFSGIHSWVRLSPDHLWGAWLTDADGNELIGDDSAGGVTIQKPGDPDSRFTIRFPPGSDVHFLSWDTPVTVFGTGSTHDVACDLVKRHCENGYAP
jgi:hypothetical protein